MTHNLYDIDAQDLLDFANAFSSLGSAVTDQIEYVIECHVNNSDIDPDYVNANAIALAQERLDGKNEQIDEALAGALLDEIARWTPFD